jgi:hypothetical protein
MFGIDKEIDKETKKTEQSLTQTCTSRKMTYQGQNCKSVEEG